MPQAWRRAGWGALLALVLSWPPALPARAEPAAPESLEPGAAAALVREPAHWSETGLLGLLPAPAQAPERWRSSGPGFVLEALFVLGERALLVLLAPLEGGPGLPEAIVRGWAAGGGPALALLPPGVALQPGASLRDWARLLAERIRAGRAALRLARKELAPACVVLMGVSLGGISAVPVAALEPPPDALVLALAGGSIEALARTTSLAALRASIGEQEVSPALRAQLEAVDPLGFAPALDPARVLFLSARWDRVVPPAASDALWQALGRPAAIRYPAGHQSFALFLPLVLPEAARFAEARCGPWPRSP